jgi:plasmid stability protein
MSSLVLPDVDKVMLARLQMRATLHGSSLEEEALRILAEALEEAPWTEVEAIRQRLAQSGRVFSDSAELVREDRDR